MMDARQQRLLRYVWLVPSIWLAIALLSYLSPGGSNITLGIGLMPGLIICRLLGLDVSGNFDFASGSMVKVLITGLLSMAALGYLLDRIRLRPFEFILSYGLPANAGFLLLGFSVWLDSVQTNFASAFRRMDLDQPERAIGLIVLCLAFGIYLFVPVSIGIVLKRRFKESSASKNSELPQ